MTTTTHEAMAVAGEQATMKAVLQRGYGGAEVLHLAEVARPHAGPGEVVVRVCAAGLDRGTWHLMTGRPYLVRLVSGLTTPKRQVPGLDLAGVVVELGPGVTRLKVGDEVFGIGQGSFAQYACAREDKLAKRPSTQSFAESAVCGVSALTALQALEAGAVATGQRVLILGASGGVGTFAVQLAHAQGAHVTAVCSAGKADLVRSLGADDVVDYAKSGASLGPTPFDLILDAGGNRPLSALRRVLTPTGRLVFVGGEQGGNWTAGFGRQLLALVLAPFVQQRFVMFMAREHFADLERIAALVETGSLRPVLDRTCGLAQVADAMRDLEAGRVRGKVAIAV